MGTSLQESSADLFKLMNEILNTKGNIILFEVPVLQKLHVIDDNFVPGHSTSLIWDKLKVQITHLRHRPIKEKKDVLDTRLIS